MTIYKIVHFANDEEFFKSILYRIWEDTSLMKKLQGKSYVIPNHVFIHDGELYFRITEEYGVFVDGYHKNVFINNIGQRIYSDTINGKLDMEDLANIFIMTTRRLPEYDEEFLFDTKEYTFESWLNECINNN